MRAILLDARTKGLMLDPTYTGKTMAGLLHRVGSASPDMNLLFLHTSGLPAIIAYQKKINDAIASVE
jgi:D-cysteine desulfhydrase